MRRMFSEKQIKEIIDETAVSSIAGKDIAPASITTEKINGETNPSVKPIYYHGLDLYDSTNNHSAQIHILNNSNEPIDTIAKLKAWAESITGDVFIQCGGCIKVLSKWRELYLIIKSGSTNKYTLCYVDPESGVASFSNVNLEDYFTQCADKLNKIN